MRASGTCSPNNTNVLELCYDNITVSAAQDVMEAALAGVKTYCEQCYNTVNCTYLHQRHAYPHPLSAADAGDRILTYRDAAMDAAIAVHDQLWESGALNASMSDYEKAGSTSPDLRQLRLRLRRRGSLPEPYRLQSV